MQQIPFASAKVYRRFMKFGGAKFHGDSQARRTCPVERSLSDGPFATSHRPFAVTPRVTSTRCRSAFIRYSAAILSLRLWDGDLESGQIQPKNAYVFRHRLLSGALGLSLRRQS